MCTLLWQGCIGKYPTTCHQHAPSSSADVCRCFPLRAVNLESDKKSVVQEEEEVEEDVQVKKRARKGSHA